tara:strand:+ start:2203 stop:2475 length:273 start_codon:yes stop_codon:yes gene_type:complete
MVCRPADFGGIVASFSATILTKSYPKSNSNAILKKPAKSGKIKSNQLPLSSVLLKSTYHLYLFIKANSSNEQLLHGNHLISYKQMIITPI